MTADLEKRFAETQNELDLANSRIAELQSKLSDLFDAHSRNSEANQALRKLTQRLEGLHRLDQAILSAEPIETVANIALDHVLQFIPCPRASISTIDFHAKTLYVLAAHNEQETSIDENQTYPLEEIIITSITHSPFVIIRADDEAIHPSFQQLYREGIRTTLLIPLRVEANIVGLLNLHSNQIGHFTQDIVHIALEVAAQIAIGIQKSLLSDALRRYAHRMEILHAIDLGLIQGGSIKELVASTLKQIQYIVPCERIGVGVIDHKAQEAIIFSNNVNYDSELTEGTRIPIPPNMFDEFDSRHIRLVNNMELSDDVVLQRLVKEGFRSHLQVLLRDKSNNIGFMGFSSTRFNFFTPEHQEIAIEIANQLAVALHQMQLLQVLERYAQDLEQRVNERTTELHVRNHQIEAILDNSLDGILLVDHNLQIKHANPAVNRLLSVELDNHEMGNLLDLIDSSDANRIKANIGQLDSIHTIPSTEIRSKQPDSNQIHLEINFGAIPDDGLVSIIHDITARKQTEEALKNALAKEKELVDARSRFASVTSHEFRTPLAIILSAAETLLTYRDQLSANQIEQKLERIRQSVQQMTSIMDDVLALSKIQSGRIEFQPKEDNLDLLCRQVIDEFKSIPEMQDRIIYKCLTIPEHIVFDNRLMKLVVTNLLSNALKYSPADIAVEMIILSDPTKVHLIIQDRGIGIPSEELKRLFEPFHRASNVGTIKGTGLGLSITKEIVEIHGGQVAIESALGQGTKVQVSLPLF